MRTQSGVRRQLLRFKLFGRETTTSSSRTYFIGKKLMSVAEMQVQLAEGVQEWLDRLGMHKELQTMIDWVKQNVSGLVGIRVELGLAFYPHLEGKRCAIINAHRESLSMEEALADPSLVGWGIWKAQTFVPRVCSHFTMLSRFQPSSDAGEG